MKKIFAFFLFCVTELWSMHESVEPVLTWKEVPILIVNGTTMGLVASVKRQSNILDHAIDHRVWMGSSRSIMLGVKALELEDNNYLVEIFDSNEKKLFSQKKVEYSEKKKISSICMVDGDEGVVVQVRH